MDSILRYWAEVSVHLCSSNEGSFIHVRDFALCTERLKEDLHIIASKYARCAYSVWLGLLQLKSPTCCISDFEIAFNCLHSFFLHV